MQSEISKEISSEKNFYISDEVIKWSKPYIENFNKLMTYYKCAVMEIETKFNVLNEEFALQHDRNPINSIKSRVKNPISIKEKLEKNKCPFTVEAIEKYLNDIAGIRVVCSFTDDVYMLADALLKQDDITLLERKDYIRNPKHSGYRSLHLICETPIFLSNEKKMMKVEIQLRTIAMDFWATIEHQLKYKKNFKITNKMQKELYLCSQISSHLDEKMNSLRKIIQEESNP